MTIRPIVMQRERLGKPVCALETSRLKPGVMAQMFS